MRPIADHAAGRRSLDGGFAERRPAAGGRANRRARRVGGRCARAECARTAGAAGHRGHPRRRVRAAVAAAAGRRVSRRARARGHRAAVARQRHHHRLSTASRSPGSPACAASTPGERCWTRWRRAAGAATCGRTCAGRRTISTRSTPRSRYRGGAREAAGVQRPHAGDPAAARRSREGGEIQRARRRAVPPSSAPSPTASRRARPRWPPAQERLAAAARAAGVPMASHDDDSIATRDAFRARGARICEFPMDEEIGQRGARERRLRGHGQPERGAREIAPGLGVGRAAGGGRHLQRAVQRLFLSVPAAGAVHPRAARRDGTRRRRGSWCPPIPPRRVASADRGVIAPGRRADLVLVADAPAPRVVATIAKGRLAYLAPHAWDALHAA